MRGIGSKVAWQQARPIITPDDVAQRRGKSVSPIITLYAARQAHEPSPTIRRSPPLMPRQAARPFPMASPLLENLNPEQLAAVTLPHASALILAGAGSGKTRVLTTRIAWLLATGQASPLSILAVTFTNKAAKEMLSRLSALTPVNTRGMWVGTFHGLCNRMLRAHYRDAATAAAIPDHGHAGSAGADQAGVQGAQHR